MNSSFQNAAALFAALPCAALWLDVPHSYALANPAANNILLALAGSPAPPAPEAACAVVTRWLRLELEEFSHFTDELYEFTKDLVTARQIFTFGVQFRRLNRPDFDREGLLIVLTDRTVEGRLNEALRRAYRDAEMVVSNRTAELEAANDSLRRYARDCRTAAAELQKLSCAIEHTADHVIITDALGIIEYVNPAFTWLTGFAPAEAVGRTPRLVNSRLMDAKFFQGLWTTLLAGDVFRAVFTNRKKSGEIYYEEKTVTPVKDTQGRITHFVSIGRDVTERRQAHQEREELVTRLQTALAHINVLRGFLPSCGHCNRIRDAGNHWVKLEDYLRIHSQVQFTHGICPECAREHFGPYLDPP